MDALRTRFPSIRTRSSSGPRVKRCARGNARDSGARVLRRELDGQLLAPLTAATAQNLTPPLRLHTRTEAVLTDTTRVARTICGFAHNELLQKRINGQLMAKCLERAL